MNKRKLMLVAVALCMAAILLAGGTLAYLTDTDNATNVFTVGNIDIKLNEDFPKQELMPGEANALDKVVTVENIGANNAYMWIEVLIPTVLDNGPENAMDNDLHWNYFDTYDVNGVPTPMRGAIAQAAGYTLLYETVSEYQGIETITYSENDVVEYHKYRIYIKNDTPKATGESTAALVARAFMDARIDSCKDPLCLNGENCLVLVDGTHYAGTWEIIVRAYGIQAEGFDSINAAIDAYYAQAAAN